MTYPAAPDLSPEDYILIGVATCYIKAEGEVEEITLLEPIPSAYAESIIQGNLPTAYQKAFALSLGQVLEGETPVRQPEFPTEAQFCADFPERIYAAARTYRRNPHIMDLVPLGQEYDRFNYTTQPKRVLNAQNIVRKEDNVKQHEYTHKVL
ncbi:MAG: hypothetical protein ACO3EZ_00685 [Prochlorotrichaceae cyanobacterium]